MAICSCISVWLYSIKLLGMVKFPIQSIIGLSASFDKMHENRKNEEGDSVQRSAYFTQTG